MRKRIPDEARRKATITRQKRSVFNRYLKSLESKKVKTTKARVAEIDEILERGTKQRRVPKFVNGKRSGTELKHVPLLPADRARFIAKRRAYEAAIPKIGKAELREEFLQILPEYAAGQGWDREILLAVGVPEVDLEAAGIK